MEPKIHSEPAERQLCAPRTEKYRIAFTLVWAYFFLLLWPGVAISSPTHIDDVPVEPLTLSGVCSQDPVTERRWLITNPNPFDVPVRWMHVSTKEEGTLIATPGEVTFVSAPKNSNPNANNVMRLFWDDENGDQQFITVTSKGGDCNCDDAVLEIVGSPFIECDLPTTLRAEVTGLDPETELVYDWDFLGESIGSSQQLEVAIPGNYSVTVSFNDICTTTSSVEVEDLPDEDAPVPRTASLPDVSLSCGETNLTIPLADDECVGEVAGSRVDGEDLTVAGDYTIVWSFDDGKGNIATQPQKVSVILDGPITPDVAELPTIFFSCNGTVQTIPTASTNCGTLPATTEDELTFEEQGTFQITWTYGEGDGAIEQLQTVVVDDLNAPIADLALLPTLSGECLVTAEVIPTATDECSGVVPGTTVDPLVYDFPGEYTITWLYDDMHGNITTQEQLVVVIDAEGPVPVQDPLPELTAECSEAIITIPTAIDNCSGSVVATTNDPLTYSTLGNHTITWVYTDAAGNSTTQEQSLLVVDTTDPTPDVDPLPELAVECSVPISTFPTATDGCGGTITATTADPLTYGDLGPQTITWTYDDGNGNVVTQTQQLVVVDTTDPVPDVNPLPTLVVECSVAISNIPTATDACAGSLTATTTDPLTYSALGPQTITWVYDDGNGNVATQAQEIEVIDSNDPEPEVDPLSPLTVECGVAIATFPTATDDCAGLLTGTTTDPLVYSGPGVQTITWTYDDGNGNVVTQSQSVEVVDTTDPTPDVDPLPELAVECSVPISTFPTATDGCGGTITATTADPLTYGDLGPQTITWTYDDGNGNVVTQTQQLVVVDTTDPVPDVNPLPTLVVECTSAISVFPTATDACGGSITGTTSDPLVYTSAGEQQVIWTYDDGNGNVSTQTQTIEVRDTQPPVPTVSTLPMLTVNCGEPIEDIPTAFDECAGTILATTNNALVYNSLGLQIILWLYDDGNGNLVTQTQIVQVEDTKAPVPNVPSLPKLTVECSAEITEFPTATDLCAGTIIGETNDPLTYNSLGSQLITWTYSDGNGNEATQSQEVEVVDTTAPVPDFTSLPTLTLECGGVLEPIPTATDDCFGHVIGSVSDPTVTSQLGTHVVTWTYDDGNGNTSTQTQTIVVSDTQAPVPTVAQLQDITLECPNVGDPIPVPTAIDACEGLIVATTASAVEFGEEGTYSILWLYVDGSGNETTQAQTVIIDDPLLPVLDAVASIDLTLGEDGTVTLDPSAVVNAVVDNCGPVDLSLDKVSFDCSDIGIQQVVVTATDINGNTATATVDVEVIANPAAIPTPIINQLRDGELTIFDGEISCFEQSNGLILVAEVDPSFDPADLDFSWSIPGGLLGEITGQTSQQLVLDAQAAFFAGAFSAEFAVTVTNGANSCTAAGIVNFTSNVAEPICPELSFDGTNVISVVDPQPNREYLWSITTSDAGWEILSGNGTSSITIQVGTGNADFDVAVTNTLNECTNENCDPISITNVSGLIGNKVAAAHDIPELNYEVKPNPIGATGELLILSEETTPVVVEMYSLTNQRVAGLYDGVVTEGEVMEIPIDLSNHIGGLYLITIRTNRKSYTLKIVHTE